MSKAPTPPEADAKSIEEETRVDEFAISQFKALGHTAVLPDSTVKIYKDFKLRKDRLKAGRLSPEGFAFVSLLADMADGRFKPTDG